MSSTSSARARKSPTKRTSKRHAVTTYRVELEQEAKGRWIADIPALPGVMVYGTSAEDALAKVEVLALRHLADLIEHGEAPASPFSVAFTAAPAA
jgi:predicted RNase H-like HicB family nuclease